jgi:hypothetical protein
MIVTFRPTINNASDVTACYLNFLRCVTAIATASAGTTTLTVNPYTASNTIDSTRNCIISIDANTEAGGWTTSTSHNVPSSGNNTPSTYTAINSAADYLYKADFYNASGKSAFPYKKLCFHTYNSDPNAYYWSTSANAQTLRSQITLNKAANMLITFGCSTSTDWTSTTFPPGAGVGSNRINSAGVIGQSSSYTLNGNTSSSTSLYNTPGLCYTDTTVEYHMAVTADYCVIWESKVGDTYANGYFTTSTTGNGTTYWNQARFGSIYYMGLRETQAWENSQNNNVPWVAWQNTLTTGGNGSGSGNEWQHDQVGAFMLTQTNTGLVSTSAKAYATQNSFNTLRMHGALRPSRVEAFYTDSLSARSEIDVPLFQTRAMGGSTSSNGEHLYTSNILYMPQTDPVSGAQVPGAYPIKISRSYDGDWNQGGACRGIYKSLSMPYANMKQYWQAAGQTFTINGDPYLPFVIKEDMWLVRFA